MAPLSVSQSKTLGVRERTCLNCNSKMFSQGVRNGLYVYVCNACNSSFEVYEPK